MEGVTDGVLEIEGVAEVVLDTEGVAEGVLEAEEEAEGEPDSEGEGEFDTHGMIELETTAKLPMRVCQLNEPSAARYSLMYQKVMSSAGSTWMLE